MSYDELISNLENGVNFSFSRFGDGELACMFGHGGYNCDLHTYFIDLGRALVEVWENPKGIIAIQGLGYRIWHERLGPNIWPNADILHHASEREGLCRFITALKKRRVILVGPKHLYQLPFWDEFVMVPDMNCWKVFPDTLEDVHRLTQANDVILYSCSMMAEVLIHKMYAEDITQIDTGSVFDPYCGVNSRSYHKKVKV